MYSKNELLEIKITDITNEGEGVGKVDGFTFFVKDTLIGDEAVIRVTKIKKTYGYARLERLINPSADRIEALCPIARQCGGCQIQNMSYDAQLRYKNEKVKNNLIRIGGFSKEYLNKIMEPIIGAENEGKLTGFRYRNKAQFPFGTDKNGEVICGFYAGRTHTIIPTTECYLGVSENKEILETILSWMKTYKIKSYDEIKGSGTVRHVLLRKGYHSGEIMVCIVINQNKLPYEKELIELLLKIKGIKSISYSVNNKNTNVIMGDNYHTIWGSDTISDTLLGLKFNISPLSFYQVNPVQVEKLYGKAIEYASLTGKEEVWDICCGIGTITLAMASKAKKVHGIEIVPQAIEDANNNAVENNIKNAEFICASAEEYLPQNADKIKADIIVMDPPRKGMDEKALEVVINANPERIVYVSCDSATLARDLKYLCERGYELSKLCATDMFANTIHVETVVLISKKA